MDIKEVQGVMQDTKIIAEEHHKAIHDALNDINSEETPKTEVKPVDVKKDETKKVEVEAPKTAVLMQGTATPASEIELGLPFLAITSILFIQLNAVDIISKGI